MPPTREQTIANIGTGLEAARQEALRIQDAIGRLPQENGATGLDINPNPSGEVDNSNFGVPNTSPTIGDQFNMPYLSDSENANRNIIEANYAKQARGEDIVDEAAIRRQAIADMQDRINAVNQVYDVQLQEARRVGEGRVGSGTAVLASRGLAGSMRGEAIKENVLGVNQRIEGGIQAERNAVIQDLMSEAGNLATKEAQRKRDAINSGGKAYLEFIKGEETRTKEGMSTITAAFIDQGIDPATLNPLELEEIAKQLGVSTQNIMATYRQSKKEQDALAAEAEAKALRDGDPLIERFEYATTNGYTGDFLQYQKEVANLKDVPVKTSGSSSSSSSGAGPLASGGGEEDFGGAFEGDYVLGRGFLTPDGSFKEIDETPTNKRNLANAKISGFDTASYFLNTPSAFQDEFIRMAASGDKDRYGFQEIDAAYQKWYDAKNAPKDTTKKEVTIDDI